MERKNERKKTAKKKKNKRVEKLKKYVYKQNKGATKSVRMFKVFITMYIVVKCVL